MKHLKSIYKNIFGWLLAGSILITPSYALENTQYLIRTHKQERTSTSYNTFEYYANTKTKEESSQYFNDNIPKAELNDTKLDYFRPLVYSGAPTVEAINGIIRLNYSIYK